MRKKQSRTPRDSGDDRPVFISHSGKDDRVVAELREALENRGIGVWTDLRKLTAGDALGSSIRTAIEDARHFIAILGLNSVNSIWIKREIQFALELQKRREDDFRVIPVLLPGIEPGALTLWFGEEPVPRTIRVGHDGVKEVLPDLLTALGEEFADEAAARASVSGGSRRTSAHPSLRVQRLEIEQFRCFEQLTIDLDRGSSLPGHWTCLVGVNGAGKSSVLQALSLVLLGETLTKELGGERLKRMRRLAGGKAQDAKLRARVTEEGVERYPDLTLADPGTDPSPSTAPYRPEMFDFWERMRKRILLSYGATRNLSPYRESRYEHLSLEVRRQITLFDPLAQIAGAETLLAEQAADSPPLRLFEGLMREVFGEELGIRVDGKQVRFTLEEEPVEAVDLPDGFRSSAAWLCDLCVAWCQRPGAGSTRAKPAEIEATVLIDEIDLHLHPSLQRTLVPQLRKALPRVQWIVTSHSPLVLSSFDSREIIALDRGEPGGIRTLDREIRGFSTDEIYQWLMRTPATGAAIQEQTAPQTPAARRELVELLSMSPEVDATAARERVQKMADRLSTATRG